MIEMRMLFVLGTLLTSAFLVLGFTISKMIIAYEKRTEVLREVSIYVLKAYDRRTDALDDIKRAATLGSLRIRVELEERKP